MRKVGIDRSIWVYDIETFRAMFCIVALNTDTEEIVKFVLHKQRNDFKELINFLKSCKGGIGFNNIGFDYPVLHDFIQQYNKNMLAVNVENQINSIFCKAQSLIEEQNKQTFGFDNFRKTIKDKDYFFPQLDLFLLWHYNNSARKQSLKGLEISMNYPNVMESEISFDKEELTLEEVDKVLEYCTNDVLATYEFYKLSKEKIQLRNDLNEKYELNCLNFSDSKIGEQLMLKLYCEKTEQDPWEIKKLRTKRDQIILKDCIFDYIKFNSKEFNVLLDKFKTKTIIETKGSIEESVIYKGFKYDHGTGGIHGVIESGIYESTNDLIIKSFDVTSLYPNLAIQNNIYPEHLGEDFVLVYKDILDQRTKAKKEGNLTISDALKLSANSVYGKSNDKYSFIFDSKFTISVTLSGQLSLAMLCEQLVDRIEGLTMLMINTDGGEVLINRNQEELFYQICKEWEQVTKLNLEYVNYDKMFISDVNNYLALTDKGKVKYKGKFEIDKVVGNEVAYHKDNSFKIIPIALKQYFIDNISIEDTIINHTNIYDFCGRQKFKGEDYGETHEVALDDNNVPYNKIIKQQKNTRYYVSTNGKTFVKQYKKGSSEFIHKGYKVTIFNKFQEKNHYSIDYQYYIKETRKIIKEIEKEQLTLF